MRKVNLIIKSKYARLDDPCVLEEHLHYIPKKVLFKHLCKHQFKIKFVLVWPTVKMKC